MHAYDRFGRSIWCSSSVPVIYPRPRVLLERAIPHQQEVLPFFIQSGIQIGLNRQSYSSLRCIFICEKKIAPMVRMLLLLEQAFFIVLRISAVVIKRTTYPTRQISFRMFDPLQPLRFSNVYESQQDRRFTSLSRTRFSRTTALSRNSLTSF